MEQLVARRAHNPKVVGSSPASATTQKPEHIVFRLFLLSISSSCNYYEKFYGVFHKNVPIETGTFWCYNKDNTKRSVKKMKKMIAWFSTLALLCSMLAGCSGETENSSPVPETLTAESVIQAFQEADIPIPYYIIYTEENDPNGDDTPYTEKGNFTDERIEITYDKNEPLGGSIEIFETPEEAEERAESLQRHIVSDPFLYQIVWKNALLRLNTAFTKEQVAEYATVFDGKMVALPVDYLHENAYCYGQPFIIHAKQLKSGMTIEEAEEIMGFDAKISGTTFFWADENSSNTVASGFAHWYRHFYATAQTNSSFGVAILSYSAQNETLRAPIREWYEKVFDMAKTAGDDVLDVLFAILAVEGLFYLQHLNLNTLSPQENDRIIERVLSRFEKKD